MFNKGKPYVPPPTRAMGSTTAHDDLHDIEDELELEAEVLEASDPITGATSYSHAAEERLGAEIAETSPEVVESPAPDAIVLGQDPTTVETPILAAASGGGSYGGSTGTSGGSGSGEGWGGSGRGTGGGYGGGYGSTPSNPSKEASSVLGSGMTFEGDISGVGQLVIEGTVKGDVRVSKVLINQNGKVEGTVHADELEVRGTVTGAIIAKQVHLHSSARVEGDVTQEQFTVDRGAWFSGRSTQARRGDEAED